MAIPIWDRLWIWRTRGLLIFVYLFFVCVNVGWFFLPLKFNYLHLFEQKFGWNDAGNNKNPVMATTTIFHRNGIIDDYSHHNRILPPFGNCTKLENSTTSRAHQQQKKKRWNSHFVPFKLLENVLHGDLFHNSYILQTYYTYFVAIWRWMLLKSNEMPLTTTLRTQTHTQKKPYAIQPIWNTSHPYISILIYVPFYSGPMLLL